MTLTSNAKKWLVAFLAVALFFSFMPAMAQNSFAAKAQKVSKIVKTSTKNSSYTLAGKGKTINLKAKVTFKKKVSKSAASKALKITTSKKANVEIAKKTFKKKSSKVYVVTVKAQAVEAGKSAKIAVKARSGAAKAKKGVSWTVKVAKAVKPAAAVQKVKINNKTPRVGDILEAVVEPADAEIATYSWMINGKEVATTATYKVAEGDVGKAVSVKVTGKNGGEATSDALTVYKEAGKLIDLDGLQTDGTALIGDKLQVTYAADIGTPSQITWYLDGTAMKTISASAAMGFTFDWQPSKAGTCNAVVTNTKGETFTSNSIVVTEQEKAAVLSDTTVTDDYDTPRIELKNADDKAILTVTMKKNYEGKFYLFEEKEEQYKKSNIFTPTIGDYSTANADTVTSKDAFKDSKVLPPKFALKYTDPATHAVSYKFLLNKNNSPRRGEKYQVVFDQTKISEDDITNAKNINVNKTAGTITIPYVTAPAKIALTKVAAGTPIELTFQDAKGTALTWMNPGGPADAGATIKVYGNTAATTAGATPHNAGNSDVEKGVHKAGNAVAAREFYSATAELEKGIYGADKINLTAPWKTLALPGTQAVTVEEDTKEATAAKIKFTNGRTAGKVYLAKWGVAIDPENPASYIKRADVAKGDEFVMLAGVFNNNLIGDKFYARFIPADEENFSAVDSADFELKANLTKYELSGKMELGDGVDSYNAANPFGGGADTCIIAKNQFDKTKDVKVHSVNNEEMQNEEPGVCTAKVNLTLKQGNIADPYNGSVTVTKNAGVLNDKATYSFKLPLVKQKLEAKWNAAAMKWVVTIVTIK